MGRSERSEKMAAVDGGKREGAGGKRSSGTTPTNVATPSRGGRSPSGAGGEKTRSPASALEDLMRRKGVDDAWNALEEMQRQGVSTDKYTISRMLMKTVGDGRTRINPARVYRGMALVERFVEMQPKDVDEVLFNALLDTCCRLKDLNRLEATVKRMKDLNISPSPVTLGILVKTYGQAGDLQKVLQVWNDMEKQRIQANAVTYGCMMDACVKCGHLEKAVEIFQSMREQKKHRNTILYTTLIKGCGLEKDLRRALELFREMPKEGVPYNTITYNSILDACIKCGDLPTAEGLLREMSQPDSGLEPDLITFSTLLKGYCHVGDLDKALQVAEAIKARGLRRDELVYNTLMDGCVKASDVAAGLGLFEEMIQSGLRPSAITHSILARLYQRAGYEDPNDAVAQLFAHHGLERPVAAGGRGNNGGGRRTNPRSPAGAGSRGSPQGSPFSTASSATAGSNAGFNGDNCWPAWDGASNAESSPSVSMAHSLSGSPMMQMPFLPMEALRGTPPQLPGAGGDGTPYGAGSRASGPVAAASPAGYSPFGFPMQQGAGDASGAFMVAAQPASPYAAQGAFAGHAAPQMQGQAAMPPWPFTAACQGGYPGTQMAPAPGVYGGCPTDGSMQVMAVPMMQPGARGTAMAGSVEAAVGSMPPPPPVSPPAVMPGAMAGQAHQPHMMAPQDASGVAPAYFEGFGAQMQHPGAAPFLT